MSGTAGPAEGAPAPDFDLPASGGGSVSLAGLRGRPFLLYFYPKADTPGCTTQACGLQEVLPQLGGLGLTVIGVSPDPLPPIEKFAAKHRLEFPLASDADHAVAEAYGVWVQKSMYGKTYMGAQRATFIVDASGTIVHVIPKASPKTHDDEVLKVLGEMSAAA